MKKIVGIIAAAVMAASVFAVDFNARVYMTGNIADGTIDINGKKDKEGKVNFWSLNSQDQKDADALVLSANGDKAGAQFQMWYKYDASGAANLVVCSTSLWFKPIDMLKVTIGDVDVGTYCEQIDYWKVATGKKASDSDWSSYATVCGAGLSAELTPIDGLWITAGVVAAPGTNLATITFNDKKDETYGAYGVAAKYSFNNLLGIPFSAAISWRDEGKDNAKILAIGGDYSNGGFYGMLNARLRFENVSYKAFNTEVAGTPQMYTWTMNNALVGISFDNYFKYSVGALNIQARLPVTIRTIKDLKGSKNASKWELPEDPSYMSYEVKVTYGLDNCSLYLDIENDTACTFDKNAKKTFLNMNIQPGVTFNVGSCALDVGLNVDVPNEKTANIEWSIPFTASVAF